MMEFVEGHLASVPRTVCVFACVFHSVSINDAPFFSLAALKQILELSQPSVIIGMFKDITAHCSDEMKKLFETLLVNQMGAPRRNRAHRLRLQDDN